MLSQKSQSANFTVTMCNYVIATDKSTDPCFRPLHTDLECSILSIKYNPYKSRGCGYPVDPSE